MLKRFTSILSVVIILLFSTAMMVSANFTERGSIRGTVYLDADGDGTCSGQTVSNVDITFSTANNRINVTLRTGPDGTYGLVGAGPGTWTIEARPASGSVTSANPVRVSLNPPLNLVRTNVDFCVSATQASNNTPNNPLLITQPVVSTDLNANHAVSEQMLNTQYPPPPAEVLQAAAESQTQMSDETGSGADWLDYLNQIREMGGLPPVVENETLTQGSLLHSRYMVINDQAIAHSQNSSNPLYTPLGHDSAKNGNIFATSQDQADHTWAMNFWVSAPFHLLGIIDPALQEVGYGQHNQDIGVFHMASVLDVRSRQAGIEAVDVEYPLFFPGDGAETWVVRRSLYEWPEPIAPCPGYPAVTGPAVVAQLGSGELDVTISSHTLYKNGASIESCAYTETTYTNPDPYAQQTGREIIGVRDAVVIIPKAPLEGGAEYTAEFIAGGQTYRWSFTTRSN